MKNYNQKTSREELLVVAEKLSANGMPAEVVANGNEAKEKILAMIPKDADVMTMTSATLDAIGIPDTLKNGGYKTVRAQLTESDMSPRRKRELMGAPDFSLASAHAITKNGEVMIVSGSGSQLPAVTFGAGQVILVVGAQKIVDDVMDGMHRIEEYVLPLESARINKVNNITTGSSINKILIIKKELQPGRIKIILVEEALGF